MANNKQFFSSAIISGLIAIIVVIVVWKIVDFARPHKPIAIFLAYRPWLIAAAISMAMASVLAFFYRKKPGVAIAAIALCAMLAFQMGSWGYQSHSPIRSAKLMADAIRAYPSYRTSEELKIYVLDRFEYSLPYYLQRKITVVVFKGNMEFGIAREPGDWIASEEEFLPLWLKPTQALVILSVQKYAEWQEQKIPMHVVYQDPRRIVIANH